MIDYTDLKQITNSFSSLNREVNDGHEFEKIHFNNFTIIIYAGAYAQCFPKIYLGKLSSYQKIQLEILESVKDERRIIKPATDERFANFPWTKYFYYSNSQNKLIPGHMGVNIPLVQVATLIREVYKVSKLKMFF